MTTIARTRGDRQVSKLFQYDSRGKKPWTVEEDHLLKDITDKNGTGNWTSIAQHFTDRSGKQCRERWHNHLNPGIKKGEWTAEEDEIIINMQQLWGNQWAKITGLLPGRTDNAVKNRFHATLRATKGKRTYSNQVHIISENRSYSSGGTTVDLDMDMGMDMDLDEDDMTNESSTPSDHTSMLSVKNLHIIYPQAQATASTTATQAPEIYPMGTVISCDDDMTSDSLVASSPVPSDSIGSIDMMTDWSFSCSNDNQFIPLEIDIDGLRDWVMDDDEMEDGSNIDEDSPRRDSSCFARMKNEAAGFCHNTVRKMEGSYEQSKGWRIGGSVTNTLCGDRFAEQDHMPSTTSKPSNHSSFFGLSNPFYQGR